MLSLFLLSFAGIPLTSGFIGKFLVFEAAVSGGATPLVIVGAVFSAVAAFFYVRVIVLMYFSDPPEDAPTVAVPGCYDHAGDRSLCCCDGGARDRSRTGHRPGAGSRGLRPLT